MLLYEDHRQETLRESERHIPGVLAVAFSPDSAAIVSAGRDGAVILRDASGHRHELIERESNSLPLHSVAFIADGSLLVAGDSGWLLYRRNERGSWDANRIAKDAPATSIAALDDSILAVGLGDRPEGGGGAFELWDFNAGRRMEPRFVEQNGVRSVAVCPDKRTVAWSTGLRNVRIWEVVKQKPVDFPQPKSCPSVAMDPEGKLLAAAVGYSAKVYSIDKRFEKFELKGHKGNVSTVRFSPDGSTIATGSWDSSVKLWDASTGKERASFAWPIGRILSLAYAPDGLRLAAGGDEGTVVVWDLD